MKPILAILLLVSGCARHLSVQTPVVLAPNIDPGAAQDFAVAGGFSQPLTVTRPQPPVSQIAVGMYWNGTSAGGFNVYYGVRSRTWQGDLLPVGGSFQNVVHADTNQCAITGLYPGANYFFSVKAVDTNGVESDFANDYFCVADQNASRIFRFYALPGAQPVVEQSPDLQTWSPAPGCFAVATNLDGMDWFLPNPHVPTFYRLKGAL